MWWHSVEALSDLNALVNFWWRSTPAYLGSPLIALQHAVLAFEQLPQEQLEVWRNLFNSYVFERTDECIAHIPEYMRGALGGIDETMAMQMRRAIAQSLQPK